MTEEHFPFLPEFEGFLVPLPRFEAAVTAVF